MSAAPFATRVWQGAAGACCTPMLRRKFRPVRMAGPIPFYERSGARMKEQSRIYRVEDQALARLSIANNPPGFPRE